LPANCFGYYKKRARDEMKENISGPNNTIELKPLLLKASRPEDTT